MVCIWYRSGHYNSKKKAIPCDGPDLSVKAIKQIVMRRENISAENFDLNVHAPSIGKVLHDESLIPNGTFLQIHRKAKRKSPEAMALEELKKKVGEVQKMADEATLLLDMAYGQAAPKKPELKPKFWRVKIETGGELGIFQLLTEIERSLGHPFDPVYINIQGPIVTLHVTNEYETGELKDLDRMIRNPISGNKMTVNIERGPPASPAK